MLIFEAMKRKNMEALSWQQQVFLSKIIMRDVKKAAEAMGITEQEAYYWYSHGLFGSDRELEFKPDAASEVEELPFW